MCVLCHDGSGGVPLGDAVARGFGDEQFVSFASVLCKQLREAGFWADYIDPCSGLPVRARVGSGRRECRQAYINRARKWCLSIRKQWDYKGSRASAADKLDFR